MAAFRSRYRHGGRWWMIGTTALIAAVFMVIFVAASGANLSGSTFEGSDGNLVVNTAGNTDWANAPNRVAGVDDPSGSTDNSFGQGTKEDNAAVTVVQGSIPPNKSDLTRFYVGSEIKGSGSVYLYLAWERSNVLGSANMDFEINKNPTPNFNGATTGPVTISRTAGDLLVTYDFTNGGSKPVLGLLRWVTSGSTAQCFSSNALPCWGNQQTLSSANSEGAINTATVTDPITGQSVPGSEFGEAAINLTGAGVFQPGVCQAFGSAFLKSRSSASFTAEVKDFVAPQPISLSNCGSITIHKVTENGDSSFGYTTTGGLSPATFSLSNGGTQTYSNLQSGSYSVTENPTAAQTAAGWALKSLSCTSSGSGTSTSVSGSTVNITEALGGIVDCTYTNHINLSPTIATVLSKSPVAIGESMNDSSTLTGATSNAGGTVTYHAYAGANTCTGTDLLNSTKTVTNGIVPNSASISFNAAGTYSFQAVYSGDANNNPATSVCSTEQLVVNKNSPSISTTLSKNPVAIGETMHDSSSLSGATSNAGGTVTYHAYAGANTCTGTDLLNSTVNVTNGSVPVSADISFPAAGTYSFQAVYSGDDNNNGATSICSTEQLVVSKNGPSISTTLSKNPVAIGETMHDSSSLSGATANAGGTVTYHAYAGANTCTGTDLLNSTVDVTNGAIPISGDISFTAAGTYSFQAVYSGDANNNPATSVCSTEQLVVSKNSPSIGTALSKETVAINELMHDSAALVGATGNAGGTVTYHAYAGANTCSGTDLLHSTVDVTNGNIPNSADISFAAAGTYSFQAVYSGDANNNGATSVCATEQLVVSKNSPSIATLLSKTTANIGDNVHDSSTLSGATGNAGGTVTYHAYAGANNCTGTDLLNSTKTVTNGVVPDSADVSFQTAGYYSFQAVYSGDANNDGATSVCSTEQLLVKTNPTITTDLSTVSANIGDSVHDSSTLHGAFGDAGGTVTYSVYSDNACSQNQRDAGTKTVTNGVVPNSDALQFNHAGTFYWQAVYSGDAKNNGATSPCQSEILVVHKNTPGNYTVQHLIPNDDFHLTGATSGAGGTITFNLYSPSDATCSGTPALTQTVSVSGNGTYSTTNTTFVASAEGTWRWQSSYSGDADNDGTTSACGIERFSIANS